MTATNTMTVLSTVTDIKVLDCLLALNLQVSIWSARKKLTRKISPESARWICLPMILPASVPNGSAIRILSGYFPHSRLARSVCWTGTASVSLEDGPSLKPRPRAL